MTLLTDDNYRATDFLSHLDRRLERKRSEYPTEQRAKPITLQDIAPTRPPKELRDGMTLIIDGNNTAYRAAFTMSLDHKGVDTSVTFGVIKMITAMVKRYKPHSVIVCWDGGVPNYRRKLLPQYKEHRKHRDDVDWDNIKRQIDELHEVAMSLHGILTIRAKGLEADDLMAQAAQISCEGAHIVTTDNDLLQCIDQEISVLNPAKDWIYNSVNYEEEFGFPPEYHLLYKILMGDQSDNVPGIKGIGPKTAQKFVQELIEPTNRFQIPNPYDYVYVVTRRDGLNKAQQVNLVEYGEDAWWNALEVMDLHYDRVGARTEVLSAEWVAADVKEIKKYYMRNGFVSLLEDSTAKLFAPLEAPALNRGVRCPAPLVFREAFHNDITDPTEG